MTWNFYEDMQLRFGASQTIGRPQFRELVHPGRPVLVQPLHVSLAGILFEVAEKTANGEERRFQVMRHGIGKAFEFGIFVFKFFDQFLAFSKFLL